jgi:hypothetical protein
MIIPTPFFRRTWSLNQPQSTGVARAFALI